jgi:hypothetical protein
MLNMVKISTIEKGVFFALRGRKNDPQIPKHAFRPNLA